MASNLGDKIIKISANSQGVKAGVDQAISELARFESELGQLNKSIGLNPSKELLDRRSFLNQAIERARSRLAARQEIIAKINDDPKIRNKIPRLANLQEKFDRDVEFIAKMGKELESINSTISKVADYNRFLKGITSRNRLQVLKDDAPRRAELLTRLSELGETFDGLQKFRDPSVPLKKLEKAIRERIKAQFDEIERIRQGMELGNAFRASVAAEKEYLNNPFRGLDGRSRGRSLFGSPTYQPNQSYAGPATGVAASVDVGQRAAAIAGKATTLIGGALSRVGKFVFAEFTNFVSRLAANLTSRLIAAGVEGIEILVVKSIQAAARYQDAQVSFGVLAGGQDRGNRLVDELQRLAIDTPFKFADVLEDSKLLLSYGVSVDDLTTRLRQLGDVSSGTGADLGRLSLAFGQVLAKGRLQGPEIRQFTEAGVGIRDFVDAFNELENRSVSTRGFLSIVEQGGVSASVVEKAFEKMTSAGGRFFNFMDVRSKTVSGRFNALSESLELIAQKIGKSIFDRFDVAGGIDSVVKSISGIDFDKIDSAVKDISDQLVPVFRQIVSGMKSFLSDVDRIFLGGGGKTNFERISKEIVPGIIKGGLFLSDIFLSIANIGLQLADAFVRLFSALPSKESLPDVKAILAGLGTGAIASLLGGPIAGLLVGGATILGSEAGLQASGTSKKTDPFIESLRKDLDRLQRGVRELRGSNAYEEGVASATSRDLDAVAARARLGQLRKEFGDSAVDSVLKAGIVFENSRNPFAQKIAEGLQAKALDEERRTGVRVFQPFNERDVNLRGFLLGEQVLRDNKVIAEEEERKNRDIATRLERINAPLRQQGLLSFLRESGAAPFRTALVDPLRGVTDTPPVEVKASDLQAFDKFASDPAAYLKNLSSGLDRTASFFGKLTNTKLPNSFDEFSKAMNDLASKIIPKFSDRLERLSKLTDKFDDPVGEFRNDLATLDFASNPLNQLGGKGIGLAEAGRARGRLAAEFIDRFKVADLQPAPLVRAGSQEAEQALTRAIYEARNKGKTPEEELRDALEEANRVTNVNNDRLQGLSDALANVNANGGGFFALGMPP